VFASENEGGRGLIARGVVTFAEAIAKKRGIARQTPRVSLTIRPTALAKRSLERISVEMNRETSTGQRSASRGARKHGVRPERRYRVARVSKDGAARVRARRQEHRGGSGSPPTMSAGCPVMVRDAAYDSSDAWRVRGRAAPCIRANRYRGCVP
jgi:hypothetical protein